MTIRRTTLAAEADDLATLGAEASRQGISLAALLREVVTREASALRARRRPHFGIARSGGGDLSELSWRDEASPAAGRLRS